MKQVLIVDDSHMVRLYHRQLLEDLSLGVEEAQNGVEALEKALTGNYDLLLVDVNMPKMDGYRFLAEVRGDPELRAIPAIMISTESQTQDRQRAYEAGANFYLFKPVNPKQFKDYVRLLIGDPVS
jgi:two-component system, chemotaxis family, chemotaxis protein CheY